MRGLRLLIVTASLELGRVLKQIVSKDNQLVIAAEANNAYIARDKILECKPDVMLITNDLPRMSGITFLSKLMPQYPVPTVMIASPALESKAYEAGVADFIPFDESRENIKNAAGGACHSFERAAQGYTGNCDSAAYARRFYPDVCPKAKQRM